jgi:hypothetical protein
VFPAGEHAFRNADGDGEELVQPPAVVVAEGGVVRLVGVVLPIPSRAEGVQDADALLGDALPVATMVVAGAAMSAGVSVSRNRRPASSRRSIRLSSGPPPGPLRP